jgi:hypothetical protein
MASFTDAKKDQTGFFFDKITTLYAIYKR